MRQLFFIVLALLALTAGATSPAATEGGGVDGNTEFVRSSCAVTLYPRLCFTSLAPYADSVNRDAVRLAGTAANVTLARVSVLRPAASAGDKEAAALKDCKETLDDAADQTRRSVEELRRLENATGTEVAWSVSNAQTWMSAAITDEDTCVDGFGRAAGLGDAAGGGGGRSTKAEVCRLVRRAKKYTSNALALVNNLVASR